MPNDGLEPSRIENRMDMCCPAPVGAGVVARSVPRVRRKSAAYADFGGRGKVVEPVAQMAEAFCASMDAE